MHDEGYSLNEPAGQWGRGDYNHSVRGGQLKGLGGDRKVMRFISRERMMVS